MQRFIGILSGNRDLIRHGTYVEAFAKVRELGDLIINGSEPIKGTEEDTWKFYEASYQLREDMRYVTVSVVSVDMFIGLEAYIRVKATGKPTVIDVVNLLFDHYISSTGIRSIGEGDVLVDGSSNGIKTNLGRIKEKCEADLEPYWSQQPILEEAVGIICDSVCHSYDWKTQWHERWRELFRVKKEEERDRLFADLRADGLDEHALNVLQHGDSDWGDAHAKVFVSFPRERIAYLVKYNTRGNYLGFFHLLHDKTGYDTFDRKESRLYARERSH
ncbi:hypothetical protein HYW21_08505 [Candidatus Woesearchaeota archaeon]|nr:hypothetical protein [Candidatus Woesearchaeota archaeon]